MCVAVWHWFCCCCPGGGDSLVGTLPHEERTGGKGQGEWVGKGQIGEAIVVA